MIASYEIPSFGYVCIIMGPESPWYNEAYAYLHDQYMSPDLSKNQRKTLIHQAFRHAIIANTL